MEKMRILGLVLIACFLISGCGSADRKQQDAAVHAADTQEEGKTQAEDTLQESKAWATENLLAAGNAQTGWDGEADEESGKENPQKAEREAGPEDSPNAAAVIADPEPPQPKPEDGDGSKYQADFLGNDSSNIKSCMIYHNGKKEALNLSTAKGKYLIRMLSGFFGEYEEGYGFFDGGMDLEWLEEVSQEKLENYYIKLQIENPVTMTFQEIYPNSESTRTVEGYDTLIIEANMDPETEYLVLFWNDGTDLFKGIAPNKGADPDFVKSFQEKYKSWEETTDWEKAFAEMEGEK